MARQRIHQGPFMLPKGHKPPDGLAYEWVLLYKVPLARKRGWKRVPKNRHRAYGFELVQGGCLLMQRKVTKFEIDFPRRSDVVAERSR